VQLLERGFGPKGGSQPTSGGADDKREAKAELESGLTTTTPFRYLSSPIILEKKTLYTVNLLEGMARQCSTGQRSLVNLPGFVC
jgi:hypothetical protein